MMCTAIIDTAAIVWDENAVKADPSPYYELSVGVSVLLEKIKNEEPIILLDEKLRDLIIDSFPYSNLPEGDFFAFGYTVYDFFSNISPDRMVKLVRKNIGVESIPNLVRPHFSAQLQTEVSYTINYIHNKYKDTNVLFTFRHVYPTEEKLVTKSFSKAHLCETVIADDFKSLESYFAQFKRVFIHSNKHHPGHEPGDYESPLSCYNGLDTILPQKYLDGGLLVGKRYYNYDEENKVYVVFFCTINNIYHGHDEHTRSKLPPKVIKSFGK